MTINGLQLPTAFEKFLEEHRYSSWDLISKADTYGNPLEADFMPLGTVEQMEQCTAQLTQDFSPPNQPVQSWNKEPDFLYDITDFSMIVCFGRTAGGAPFCFGFRDGLGQPGVIFWDDSYSRWRKLAPNFDAFISLFEPYKEGDDEQ